MDGYNSITEHIVAMLAEICLTLFYKVNLTLIERAKNRICDELF